MDELFETILSFPKANIFIVCLFLGSLICAGIGVAHYLIPKSEPVVIQAEKEVKSAQTTSGIVVDIEGAVGKPGVYHMEQESRLMDLITKADGLDKSASNEYVAKSMNMASRLTDGMKIYVPFKGEEQDKAVVNMGGSVGMPAVNGLININTASEGELDTLSGVGPATAAKIIANRPYANVDELLAKKSVGQSVFSKIKDKVIAQ